MAGNPGGAAANQRQSKATSRQVQQAREQQAVLNNLRRGGVVSGAQPANPIIGGIQSLFGGAGKGAIPALGAARLGGQEVLMNRGGWDTRRAGSGPINVGGQTWYPAQSGQDLVYKRAPGLVGGQYGSLFSGGTVPPSAPPADNSNPAAERAYQQEVSRVAQLTAQDPELQRYEQARQKAVAAGPGSAAEQSAEDIGMQIWAQKYGKTLAPKVKPGQAGYDVIQRTLNAGQMGAPADLGAFTGAAPAGFLGSSGAPATSSYTGVTPVNLGMGAIGPNALTNAYNMQTASSFNRFMEGPTLSSQPLGAPTASIGEVPTYSQLSQPQSYGLGPIPGEEETFGSDASQKFANTYAKKLLNFQPI